MNFSSNCLREISNQSFGNSCTGNNNAGKNFGGYDKTPGSSKKSSLHCRGPGLGNAVGQSKTPSSANKKQQIQNKYRNITPSRNANFTNNTTHKTPGGGDRFVPVRHLDDHNEIAHYLLKNKSNCNNSTAGDSDNLIGSQGSSTNDQTSPHKQEYHQLMSYNLNGGITSHDNTFGDTTCNFRILQFTQDKAPLAPRGMTNASAVLYSAKPFTTGSTKKPLRHIPSTADRILDAPEIHNDYYLNILDWSVTNRLAVALAGQVFLWNAATGDIQILLDLESTTEYVSSLSWAAHGTYLAVGLSDSTVQLWDVGASAEPRRLRVLRGHTGRVGALTWNNYVLTSGDFNGSIINHDVREANHLINELSGHTQQICGLKWSPNGRYLASGGNDNCLNIWQQQSSGFHSESTPLYAFNDHSAAVKALAWCPWQQNVLASGGGTLDRHIRFWNCNTGSRLGAQDTQSQVCSLLWSSNYKELLSAHGYPNYQLTIWNYPRMQKISELTGHTERILHTAMSPCGEYVVSAAADESLRIWHCFKVDPEEKKKLNENNGCRSSSSSSNKKVSSLTANWR